ncbi:transporter [Leifsonia virtsii]|uniref:Transporter n=1 Tax=Leifsonia virtsii TaxID=3035915 RepID=A0ABT8J1I9_9MICO|nr:transporter [Leifsonia virtsii]MDN4598955.1 transporter [Leifsonia virtsii]
MTAAGPRKSMPRIPLNTFAICFGIAGLATVWSTVTTVFGWNGLAPAVLWCATAVAWVWLIIAHLNRGRHSTETLRSQLRHPAQGPIAAVIPAIGMLLGSQLTAWWPVGAVILTAVSFVAAVLFGGWILSYWHTGALNPEAFHGAYLLPTVGGSFIASIVAARLQVNGVAVAAFAVGLFFWIVLLTVLLSRLALFPPLPDALTPTLAILLAPPALGGTAWFLIAGTHRDPVSLCFLGMLAIMVLLQLFLIGTYRKLQFSLGFWSLTFPVAAAASYGIQWVRLDGFPGWEPVAVLLAVVPTVLTLIVAVRSLALVTSVRRGARRAEQTLRKADDAVTRPVTISRRPHTRSDGTPAAKRAPERERR